MKRNFLTADKIRDLQEKRCSQLVLQPGDVLTPLAKDMARELNIEIVAGNLPAAAAPTATANGGVPASGGAVGPDPSVTAAPAVNNELGAMEALVRQVVLACLPKMGAIQNVQSTPVKRVAAQNVEMMPFPFEINRPEMDVRLADVITAQHGSPMGVGFLSFHKGSFPWTLTYDEIEMVLEGEIHIGTAQGTEIGKPGDILYVPKGTPITFETPSWAKILYVTYPAEWSG